MTYVNSTVECINSLLERVHELRPVYDEHICDYDELLPYVFLCDVSRYVVEQVRSGRPDWSSPLARILDFLEQCMASDDDKVKEMVSASFIESLAEYDDVLSSLREQLGSKLREGFKNYGK